MLGRWRTARRAEAERAAAASDQLQELRTTRAGAEQELLEIRELLQRRDVDEAETRLRLETAIERLRTEHDVEPAVALDAPAPEVPAGTTLAGRARDLDRELRLMGPINPLALEEHDALLERHEFLQAQLEDVRSSRRELNRVIRAVDKEIIAVFEAAFADVAENFQSLFGKREKKLWESADRHASNSPAEPFEIIEHQGMSEEPLYHPFQPEVFRVAFGATMYFQAL